MHINGIGLWEWHITGIGQYSGRTRTVALCRVRLFVSVAYKVARLSWAR